MMNVQKNINKLLLALKMAGHEYFINTQQFKSNNTGKTITKYIIYDDNPRNGIECFSKNKVLESLVLLYKDILHGGDSS
jgi:LytS/YehU family sensor histidine kinase